MRSKLIIIGVLAILIFLGAILLPLKKSTSGIFFNTSQTAVVKEIQALQRLETAVFTIEKIIEAGTETNAFQEILYGDRILLIAHGQIIAGFNLSEISEKDVNVSGQSLRIQLPPPQILVTSLDNEKTRVYDRKLGLLSKGDKDLEAQARLKAESEITKAACEAKILEEASENARKQLTTLFTALGFSEITINIPQGSCSQ